MRKVFVSSTSEDLKPYRQAAKDVVLDLGWHPEMMEHFGTDGSVGIVEACKQRLGASDLVLAILGWRRGWVPGPEVGGDGRSITQIEIDTAKTLGKPIVTLLARDDWPGKLWESDPGARQQVEALRGIDRLAVFFRWEPFEAGDAEPLPEFRAKARQALLRHVQVPVAPVAEPPTPRSTRTRRSAPSPKRSTRRNCARRPSSPKAETRPRCAARSLTSDARSAREATSSRAIFSPAASS